MCAIRKLLLTLSPHIDRLSQVLTVCNAVARVLHAALSATVLKKSTLSSSDPNPRSGTWKRRFEDLNRNGRAGVEEAVYATTLLCGCELNLQPYRNRART
jgi:hypothetical protein